MLKTIIPKGNIGHQDWYAQHWAAAHNAPKLMEKLIELNADVNLMTNLQRTPLHLAVLKNNYEVVDVLLKNNADFNLTDSVYSQLFSEFLLQHSGQFITRSAVWDVTPLVAASRCAKGPTRNYIV